MIPVDFVIKKCFHLIAFVQEEDRNVRSLYANEL
jgi:hypothetical protein